MRVVVAFDKFKDALSASDACLAAARALRDVQPDWMVDLCPLTDGGEGFTEILTHAAGGEFETVPVPGPRHTPVQAPIGFVRQDKLPPAALHRLALDRVAPSAPVAIIGMAAASGLALLHPRERDPWQTSTIGTGELIRAAARRNVAAILLGIGGSATNDLGLGALAALGLEFRTASGDLISLPVPSEWHRIARITGSIDPTLPPIRIACDVTNPLLGPRGCSAVYGPQKGLRPEDLPRLEHALARMALLLCHATEQPDHLMDTPGAGAAGGISFGLMAAAGARLLPGFELVQAWLELDRRLAAADIVITGEGRFDQSSLEGKGPGAIAARALALGKRVHVFAGQFGRVQLPEPLHAHAITPSGVPLPEALQKTADNLQASIGRTFTA